MAIVRVTGAVERLSVREGVSKKTNEPYAIHTARIATNEFVATEVTLGRQLEGKLVEGEVVDLIVDAYPSNGYLRLQASGYWPADTGSRHIKSA
jgi:hypothetical protein